MNCCSLSVANSRGKSSRGTQSWGVPILCEFYLQELYQVLTVNIFLTQKSPCASGRGRRTSHFELRWSSLFLTWSVPQRNLLTAAKTAAVLSEPNWPGGREYPTPAPSSHPVPPKAVKRNKTKLKSTCEAHGAEAPAHWKTETHSYDCGVLLLPLRGTTTLPKASLQQSPLPGTPCPVIKKKLQEILKGKKHNLKRQRKHQKQTWQKCWDSQTVDLKQL